MVIYFLYHKLTKQQYNLFALKIYTSNSNNKLDNTTDNEKKYLLTTGYQDNL